MNWYAGPMDATITAEPAAITHADGYALFQAVIAELEQMGWARHRVDTFRHRDTPHNDRDAYTIRHHYDHGTWEIYYELDRYWHPGNNAHKPGRTAYIRINNVRLPTVEEILSQLFGPAPTKKKKVKA